MIKDSDVIYKYALFTYYIKNPSNYEFAEVMMIGASKTKFDIIQIDDAIQHLKKHEKFYT